MEELPLQEDQMREAAKKLMMNYFMSIDSNEENSPWNFFRENIITKNFNKWTKS